MRRPAAKTETDTSGRRQSEDRGEVMLALRKTSTAFGLDVVEVDEPGPPAAHEVQIEIAATGICGSDLHMADHCHDALAGLRKGRVPVAFEPDQGVVFGHETRLLQRPLRRHPSDCCHRVGEPVQGFAWP